MNTSIIERLILEAARDENLTRDEFIEDFQRNPDQWYAFRHSELEHFVTSILREVAALTDCSAVVPTGPTHEQLLLHFGLVARENSEKN